MSSRVLTAAFVCAVLCLLLPILWPVPFVIGILAVVRQRVSVGVVLIVLSLVLPVFGAGLVVPNFVKPYRVPSETMTPTLKLGDRFVLSLIHI